MAAFVVGITGGVASGKSELGRQFQALGVALVDADVAAREVVAPGQPALAEIATRFGAGILTADGLPHRLPFRPPVVACAVGRAAQGRHPHPPPRSPPPHA